MDDFVFGQELNIRAKFCMQHSLRLRYWRRGINGQMSLLPVYSGSRSAVISVHVSYLKFLSSSRNFPAVVDN